MEEMKYLKPLDKVTLSVMNACTGRNESERNSSLEIVETRWPSICIPCEGNTSVRKVTEAPKMHRRGGSGDMYIRTWYATGETLLSPLRNYRKQGRHYNRTHGKCAEGQRESDGIILARKSGNADGVKYPCCKTIFLLNARQG
jgi:hypothetical protein